MAIKATPTPGSKLLTPKDHTLITPTKPVGGGGGQQLQTREEANANFRKAAYTSLAK